MISATCVYHNSRSQWADLSAEQSEFVSAFDWLQDRVDDENASRPAPFYGLNQDMPLLLAIVCGLQHALASESDHVCGSEEGE